MLTIQVFEDDLVLTYAAENIVTTNQANLTLELGPDGYQELPEYDVIFSQAGLFQLINIDKLGLTVMSDTGQ